MADVGLVDVSLRDGNQSLWGAAGLRSAHVLQVSTLSPIDEPLTGKWMVPMSPSATTLNRLVPLATCSGKPKSSSLLLSIDWSA